jgi:hypothetical protein
MNARSMRKAGKITEQPLRPEYRQKALGPGVRGKYLKAYREAFADVRLDPDVAAAFPDSEAVNRALRGLLRRELKPVPRGSKASRTRSS